MSEYYRPAGWDQSPATNDHILVWKTLGLNKGLVDAAALNDIAQCVGHFSFATVIGIKAESVKPASELISALFKTQQIIELLYEKNSRRSKGMVRLANEYPNTLTLLGALFSDSGDVERMKSVVLLCRTLGGGFLNFIERVKGLELCRKFQKDKLSPTKK